MIFDGPLADAEVGRNVLAGMAGEDEVHDLALPQGQAGDLVGGILPPRGALACVARLLQRPGDAGRVHIG